LIKEKGEKLTTPLTLTLSRKGERRDKKS